MGEEAQPARPGGGGSGQPLACCVEGPPGFRAKARYAVEALLAGLGLAPQWRGREALDEGGLYYGPASASVPVAALRVHLDPATPDAFAAPRPLDPTRVGHLDWDGDRWPLPFDGGEQPEDKDVIASTFFWLSGWDEAARPARDRHGRALPEHALLARLAPDLPPLVDVYRQWLGARLAARGIRVPGRTWGGRRWAVAVTVDVDVVRTRRLGRLVRGLAAGRVGQALRAFGPGDARWQALHDLAALAEARGARATWFVKAGAATPEDVRYRLASPSVRRFIGSLAHRGHEIGLHPSYAAYDHAGRLAAERDRLADRLGRAPQSVRTHYLRWAEPATPRLLEAAGFRLDSTLGYATRPGYRRAVATPFRLFDRAADRPLGLWELPLAVMDTTLFEHRGLSAAEAESAAWAVCAAAQRVGGCAVLLWHNWPTDPRVAAERLGVLSRVLDRAHAAGAYLGALGKAAEEWSTAHAGGT